MIIFRYKRLKQKTPYTSYKPSGIDMPKTTMHVSVSEPTVRIRSYTVWALCLFMTISLLLTGCSLQPKKLDKGSVWEEAQSDIKDLSDNQEAIEHPVTLYEAMARAIKYNRENRLKMMQSALAMKQRDLSAFDLLPDLTATAGYIGRDNVSASSSESYATGEESLEASTSQDKRRRTSDASFTWSVLDFGLSYVRAKQESDRYLMTREVERKTVQNIVSDVRVAWWQALSAQRMLSRIDPLMKRVEKALDVSRQIEKQRLDAPLKALTYQRGLLDMMRTLEILRKDLNQAKPRLASLMGLSYRYGFTLADPEKEDLMPHLDWDVTLMEKIALLSRPELMESRYQNRITSEQTRVAILGLLPNIDLNAGWNWDSNSYLINNSWMGYGSQISWNLMQIFRAPAALRTAKAEEEVTRQRRLAMSMTVLMQVHLSKANYLQSARQFSIEDMAFSVEDRILKQTLSASATNTQGKQILIREQLNHLLAGVRRDKTYADLQNNFGRILVSMGIDPIPAKLDTVSVSGLATALEKSMIRWQAKSLDNVEGLTSFLPQAPVSLVVPPYLAQPETPQPAPEKSADSKGSDAAEPGLSVQPSAPTEKTAATEEAFTPIPADKKSVETQPETVIPEPLKPIAQQAVSSENNNVPAVAAAPQQMVKGPRVIVTADRLNIRRYPDLKANSVARTLRKDEELPLLDTKAGWVQVDLHGITGWVSDQYITVIPE